MVEKKGLLGALFGGKTTAVEDEPVADSSEVKSDSQGKTRRRLEVMEVTPAVVENAKLTLLGILKAMEFEVDVVTHDINNNAIQLEITGEEDLGLVIGKEGNTLNSLQFILSNMLSRKYEKRVYVHLDANDYKAKQDKIVIAAATDAAEVAAKEGVQIILDPMNSAQRRLVHTVLQEKDGIETFSRGEGRNRQVVVSPKDFKADGDSD